MESGDTCGSCCNCSGCHGRGWTFFLLRALLAVIVLMIVFWCGVAAGRLSSGYYFMRWAYPTGVYNGSAGGPLPMMRINGATSSPVTGGVENY